MAINEIIEKSRELFFSETMEMLTEMESCLLNLEKDYEDDESINALFRAVHTIKGSSGMFELSEIENFAHVVENLMDDARNKIIPFDPVLIELLLECHDYITQLLEIYEKDPSYVLNDNELIGVRDLLISKLKSYKPDEQGKPGKKVSETHSQSKKGEIEEHVLNEYWHISLRFKKNVFRNSLDPRAFINYLSGKGTIKKIVTVYDSIPVFEDFDPESCYLGFEIAYDTGLVKKKIEEIFEFVMEDCDVRILPPYGSINEYIEWIQNLPETPMRIGEILKKIGTLTDRELEKALNLQKKTPVSEESLASDAALIGKIMVDEKIIHKTVLDAALQKQKDVEKAEERKSKTLRIDAVKVDELINIVGELVITGAAMKQISERINDNQMQQTVVNMSRLIENIRDRTMNIRMVQIGETFKRYERVIRDLSKDMGKEIDLEILGSEAELDKSLVEKISDPLMHLIRNSIDHGIETPSEREKIGKERRGKIVLNAYHETGNIVIEVKDDGRGLNKEKILNKAVQVGLAMSDTQLTENEIFQFIFEPGFSTAEKVTNISGRGVGMDVVKKNIESLRGTILMDSTPGTGTSIKIHLPLTLAIIDGFMVQVADMNYVLPLDMVVEGCESKKVELTKKGGGNYINLRGELLPFLKMREFFGEEENDKNVERILVVEYLNKKIGLVVDRLIGELQTVIKPLGVLFSELTWISGATILGTGEVALILDVPKLIQQVK